MTNEENILIPKQAQKKEFEAEKIILKEDHRDKPFWVNFDGKIILETFGKHSKDATDFLIAISEPVSRPKLIHEYKITAYSLYAAASVGLSTAEILATLDGFSKNRLPDSMVRFVKDCTLSYGKIKLVLKDSAYYIETESEATLCRITKDPTVRRLLYGVDGVGGGVDGVVVGGVVDGVDVNVGNIAGNINTQYIPTNNKTTNNITTNNIQTNTILTNTIQTNNILTNTILTNTVPNNKQNKQILSVRIQDDKIEDIKKRCIEIDYPLIEEYDFRNDKETLSIEIDLKPNIAIRPYQETSLNKMFGNSRSRSGIIVLPCGAGKTLVGITAVCTIKKSCLILCTSAVSVEQWRAQLLQFTGVDPSVVKRFTSERKEALGEETILVTTYSMLSFTGKRSLEAQRILEQIRRKTWGLLVLDEVHVVPAQMFRRVLSHVRHRCKLGLTATLLREDDKIEDLNFLIGPKLYEADWQGLAQAGHIATVRCAEVWCEMTGPFYREYLVQDSRKRGVLAIMNPAKFRACEYLIRHHEARGDKIIVFSDSVCALKTYALRLGKPFIYGPTSQPERMRILAQFQNNPAISTIFLSKVGDTSIDLPEATVLIQISSHFGSRRQEAQRLGRILRARRRNDPGFKVYFYSLVSMDTDEMYYSEKRRQFLIDQGYVFDIVTSSGLYVDRDRLCTDCQQADHNVQCKCPPVPRMGFDLNLKPQTAIYRNFLQSSKLSTPLQEKELLASILIATEIDLQSEESEDEDRVVKTKNISNIEKMAYMEKNSTKPFIGKSKKK